MPKEYFYIRTPSIALEEYIDHRPLQVITRTFDEKKCSIH